MVGSIQGPNHEPRKSIATRYGQASKPLTRKGFEETTSRQWTLQLLSCTRKKTRKLVASRDGITDTDAVLESECTALKKLEAHDGSLLKLHKLKTNTFDVKHTNGNSFFSSGPTEHTPRNSNHFLQCPFPCPFQMQNRLTGAHYTQYVTFVTKVFNSPLWFDLILVHHMTETERKKLFFLTFHETPFPHKPSWTASSPPPQRQRPLRCERTRMTTSSAPTYERAGPCRSRCRPTL